jgi:TRAP-type C4-dicarboxylate transport system permease small subunit
MTMDLKRPVQIIHLVENTVLVVSLVTLMALAVMQIGLRNFLDTGVVWADTLVRILVLWVALLGAMVATRENNHIKIDALSRYLSERLKKRVSAIVGAFAAIICGVASWFSLEFVLMESEDPTIAFAGVPHWVCEVILPFAFAVMSIRFLLGVVNSYAAKDG